MQEHLIVSLDGKDYLVEPGTNLLQFIKSQDTFVPSICYNESLGPIQTCDTCTVEIDGQIGRACSTTIDRPMVVNTQTDNVQTSQKEALDRILEKHMLYCTVCDYNNGDCEIHNTMDQWGLEHQTYEYKEKPYEKDYGPFYRYDPNQCILCGRCVEVCQDVQVNETLTIDWERQQPRVIWDNDTTINDSSCVGCGQCATVCPCNAMLEVNMEGNAGYMTDLEPGSLAAMIDLTKKAEPGYGPLFAVSDSEAAMREERIEKTKTVCTYCGVGCSFDVWTKDREVLKVQPQHESPANKISSCVKGKFGWDYVDSDERLTKPLVRKNGQFEEVEWEEALQVVSDNFTKVKDKLGPDGLAFISSSKATNEESYLMQKLARQVIGTNNVDNCSRYCQAPATKGLFRTVGHGGDSGSIDDLEIADMVVLIGTNTAEAHPVIASRIKRGHKLYQNTLNVFDIRKHEMAERADNFYQPKPGTDLVWLSAVTKYIIDNDLHDIAFIDEWVNDFEAYRTSLEPFTMDFAEETTGITAEALIDFAHQVVNAKSVSICWAMGVTQQDIGSDTSTAISNLLLATGNYRKPGSGAYPLRGHNNVQGCSDMGSMPDQFPGYQLVTDDEVRARFEREYGESLPSHPGRDNHQMMEGIHEGEIDSLYLYGEDTGIVDSNINFVQAALEKVGFLVVQDEFFTFTASYADVVLPASPSLEKTGTFTNTERRIQRIYQALEPKGDSKPDWQIIQAVAKSLGYDWGYTHPSQIMDEVSRLTPLYSGVNYDRLEGYNSLQWPVAADGTDEPTLYLEGFNFDDAKARFYPLSFDNFFKVNEVYDLHVNNGRLLEHFHEGNMTYKVPGLEYKMPNAFVEISPELAEDRGIHEGAEIKLISETGEAELVAHVTDRVKGKEIYIPLNNNAMLHGDNGAINLLTNSDVDKDTDTPSYKRTSCRMEVKTRRGKSPLNPTNFRVNKQRQPQYSVRVEDKWRRDDYTFPGSQVDN
ncbi:formate dehydrogenase subunit alpha [Staphylococcus gallinarum]|uniref:formate dehydrogenase subunit alpha n=1 Tax=Staphylococcus gallinarum TaxID=1293 RepID=UPI001E38303A|nr:formate dehydrogenase subunit alpha [Staphylococcus gallinarum]MCD8785001.1 formate dehydrogenase subunit alpha [Staphylococcus gallinarum]